LFLCCWGFQGHKIQATIPNNVISAFVDQVVEGRVYRISSLTVRFNFGTLLPSYHRYKFVFNENTVVVPSPNCFLPIYGLSLIGPESVHKKRGTNFAYMIGKFIKLHMLLYMLLSNMFGIFGIYWFLFFPFSYSTF
jgi:hypothetical protein